MPGSQRLPGSERLCDMLVDLHWSSKHLGAATDDSAHGQGFVYRQGTCANAAITRNAQDAGSGWRQQEVLHPFGRNRKERASFDSICYTQHYEDAELHEDFAWCPIATAATAGNVPGHKIRGGNLFRPNTMASSPVFGARTSNAGAVMFSMSLNSPYNGSNALSQAAAAADKQEASQPAAAAQQPQAKKLSPADLVAMLRKAVAPGVKQHNKQQQGAAVGDVGLLQPDCSLLSRATSSSEGSPRGGPIRVVGFEIRSSFDQGSTMGTGTSTAGPSSSISLQSVCSSSSSTGIPSSTLDLHQL